MKLEQGIVVDGRYRLIERIGSGGMADVWRAHDAELGRDVALKLLHENFARDTEFVERFRREASAAAGLQHPNVVGVFDRGKYEDSYYIAMELVEGTSLRALIDQGLRVDEAIEVARQVLAAAEFAHSKGIVHRDLKPMNVLIDREGRVRVTDFGIARAGGSEITRTGSVMGTAQYLSPEQAQGMDVTAASDIYSIGVILFEMLCGRVPFDGDNTVAIAMKQVAEEPVRPSSVKPAIPPALDAIVLKALAKDPAQRFVSAAQMSAALDVAESDPGAPLETGRLAAMVAEDEQGSRRKRWIIAGVIALLIAGAALAWFLTRPEMATVSDVVGESQAEATIELQDAGFEVDIDLIQSQVPEDEVIEQDPRGGAEAEVDSTVTLTVSLGPGTVAVPRVSGMSAQQARRALREAGFAVEAEKRSSDSVASGRAVGTDPSQGTSLEAGETVTLIISTGADRIEVPNVVGLDRVDAGQQLRDAGFTVNATPTDSDEPEDTVLTQSPSVGETLKDGGIVRITYSNGVGTIELEDFVGQKLNYAQRRLEQVGLSVSTISEETDDSSENGIVLDQAPSAGGNLSPGDRVTLTVGEYVQPEQPDSGQTTTTEENAER